MKRMIMFDIYADSYEVSSGSSEVRMMPGVKSVEILQTAQGSPRYCMILETEDDKDAEVNSRLQEIFKRYSQYISNVSMKEYRKIG